jgi:hypothetical protein
VEIRKLPANAGGDRAKYFARHTLRMPGDGFKRLRSWFKDPSSMTPEDEELVRKALGLPSNPPVVRHGSGNATREIVDHTISLINSVSDLISRSSIAQGEIREGDRLQMKSAVTKICNAAGIPVRFADKPSRR